MSQDIVLELVHMVSGEVKRISFKKADMTEMNGSCVVSGSIKFPAGDIKLTIYDFRGLPVCNPRRQNTKENAANYDPSKGN